MIAADFHRFAGIVPGIVPVRSMGQRGAMGLNRVVSTAEASPELHEHRVNWQRIRPILVDVSVVFLLSRLLFYGAALLAPYFVPAYAGDGYEPWYTGAPALVDASWRWDSGWYGTIMRQGYDNGHGVAFFPLYPLLVRGLLVVVPDAWVYVLGVLVNHILFAAGLVLVWLYAASLGGRAIARRAIIWLSLFPTSYFFSAAYSEPLFLLLGAGTLLLSQRGRFAAAGLAGGLATLTRPTGIILAIPCLVDLIRRRDIGWRRRLLPFLLIPMGSVSYLAYLAWRFGDPLHFVHVEGAGWGHAWMFPPLALVRSVQLSFSGELHGVSALMNGVNTLAAIGAIIFAWRLWRWDQRGAAFVLAGVLLPLSVGIAGMPAVSLARYVVVLFPIFILLARWTPHRWQQAVVAVLFVPAQILLTMLFVQWYWVI